MFCGLVGLFGGFVYFLGGGVFVCWFGLGFSLFFLLLNTDNSILEARAGKPCKALFCR